MTIPEFIDSYKFNEGFGSVFNSHEQRVQCFVIYGRKRT